MDDRTIQNAIHALHDDYDALARLLTCYEAWGGRTPGKPGADDACACFVGQAADAAQ